MKNPVKTPRLRLRPPQPSDREFIFGYSTDPDVVRYVGWPRHQKREDTDAFLAFSDACWSRDGVGPLSIVWAETDTVIGGTGLAMETSTRASTGYVLAKDFWGQGIATEALAAVVAWAKGLESIQELVAYCHADHLASQKVLTKCGFANLGPTTKCQRFPNLVTEQPIRVLEFRYNS